MKRLRGSNFLRYKLLFISQVSAEIINFYARSVSDSRFTATVKGSFPTDIKFGIDIRFYDQIAVESAETDDMVIAETWSFYGMTEFEEAPADDIATRSVTKTCERFVFTGANAATQPFGIERIPVAFAWLLRFAEAAAADVTGVISITKFTAAAALHNAWVDWPYILTTGSLAGNIQAEDAAAIDCRSDIAVTVGVEAGLNSAVADRIKALSAAKNNLHFTVTEMRYLTLYDVADKTLADIGGKTLYELSALHALK